MLAKKQLIIPIFSVMLLFAGGFLFSAMKSKAAEKTSASAAKIDFAVAARKNFDFQYSLRWTLGRRAQRGWYLYVPLIKQDLNTESEVNSHELARSVAKWQRTRSCLLYTSDAADD